MLDEEDALEELEAGALDVREPPVLAHAARLASSRKGISYLPGAYFAPLVARGALCQLNVQPDLPTINYYAVHKKNIVNPVVSRVIDIAREECAFEVAGAFLPHVPPAARPIEAGEGDLPDGSPAGRRA